MPDIRLVYTSRRADHVSDSIIVDDIVLPSMAKNRRLDITGCLWFDQERFLQVLEGPDDSVDGVYEKIAVDPRHHQITLLQREPLPARLFGRWALKPVPAANGDIIRDLAAGFVAGVIPPSPAPDQPTDARQGLIQRVLQLLTARTG